MFGDVNDQHDYGQGARARMLVAKPPLESLSTIVFVDGLVVMMRREDLVRKVSVYVIIGSDLDGNKSCFGIYLPKVNQPPTG